MYRIETTPQFDKELKKIDKGNARFILKYIKNNILPLKDPRLKGKALVGDKRGFWRYRIGDYRLICKIEDDKLLILALSVGHRKDVYKKF